MATVLFLSLCGSLLVNLIFTVDKFSALGQTSTYSGRAGVERVIAEPKTGRSSGYIAVVPIEGVIQSDSRGEIGRSMVDDIKIALRMASEDPAISAVVLDINSPGGEVTASDIIYSEVKALSRKKPVVVSLGATGASGAYYIACASDYIVANETTFTGSIGVIMQSINYEGLMEKVGVDPLVFKSGEFKDMLSGARPTTDAEKQYVQGMVTQVYEKFLDIVATSRELSRESLRTGTADGRILTGKDAKSAGLIDATGYLEDAFAKARELSGDSGAGLVYYKPEVSFGNLMRQLGASERPMVKLSLVGESQFMPKVGVAYYLPQMYSW
jgi:protease-4